MGRKFVRMRKGRIEVAKEEERRKEVERSREE